MQVNQCSSRIAIVVADHRSVSTESVSPNKRLQHGKNVALRGIFIGCDGPEANERLMRVEPPTKSPPTLENALFLECFERVRVWKWQDGER